MRTTGSIAGICFASCLSRSTRHIQRIIASLPIDRRKRCLERSFKMSLTQQPGLQEPERPVPTEVATPADVEKNGVAHQTTLADGMSDDDSDADTKDFQEGVQRVRAITTVWSKKTLASMFAM